MEKYKVSIPEGKSGDWEVKRFTVSEEDAKFDMIEPWVQRGKQTPDFSRGENCPFAIIIPIPEKQVSNLYFLEIGKE